jgi:exopolyphosphatase/guanosine-5'-triphosphate,3'-diphosphate pyrophosphatase
MSDVSNLRRAVIDIGTNSVKLLVAEVRPASINPVWEENEQTRLGEGFYRDRILQPEAIARTSATVSRFARIAREKGAEEVRVIATSAARDASNRSEFLDAVLASTGLPVVVLSGETEAEWSYAGVLTNPDFRGRRLLVLDVGGGSTEFIVGSGSRIEFRQSFEMGSVRILEALQLPSDPSPGDLLKARALLEALLRDQVLPALAPHLTPSVELALGVGGTTAILALIHAGTNGFDRRLIESTCFTAGDLTSLVERLWSMPLSQRRHLPGLPPERADVILTGSVIYESILRVLKPPGLGISTRGLRFGALSV